MNMRKIMMRFGMFVAALALGVLVMVVAQDAQRLQRQQSTLSLKMEANAERLRVLEAEWAYLTRPTALIAALQKAEPDAQWVPIRGESVVTLERFLGETPPRVAAVTTPPVQ